MEWNSIVKAIENVIQEVRKDYVIDILKNAGKAKEKSVINKIWNESHN